MITLLFSLAGFFWARTLYSYYVKNNTKDAIPSFAIATSLTVFAYIASKINKKEEMLPQYEGIEPYNGIIINPDKVKKSCHCEPVCHIMCFAKGAIGALSEEQVKKYCPNKLRQVEQEEKKSIQMLS